MAACVSHARDMKFIAHNWFRLAIIVALLLFVGAYYWTESQGSSSAREVMELRNELEATKAALGESETRAPEVVEKKIYVPAPTSNETVLLNYKVDMQEGEDVRDLLLTAAFNTPRDMCPAIIAERTMQEHAYYLALDGIAELKSKYGKYRAQITYIDNNLNSLDQVMQIVRDKCEAVGYYIY